MNIVEPIIRNVFELPDTTALVDLSGGKENHISFYQLGVAVSKAIREIERLGINSQDCVAINFKDPALDLVYFVALSALGVGVYPVASFSGIEMLVIERLGISICINDNKNISMPIKSVSVRNILQNSSISKHQNLLFRDLKSCSDRPWLVRNTSGTTGDPKVFFSNHLDGASRRRRYEEIFDIASSSFLSFTLAHFGAARQRLFYSLCAGRKVFPISRDFSFEKIISIINSFKIDLIYAVPLHLENLIGEAEVRNEKILFGHLPVLECTSSLLRDDVEKYVTQKVTPNLVNAYSFSELGHICATEIQHGSVIAAGKDFKSAKMSRFVSGVEVQIKNSFGESVGPNEKGLIAVRLKEENFSVKHLDSTGKRISSLKDGWFYPGDLGAKSLDGDLTLFGRADDMLIFNGINIHPSEIERAARDCTHVKDAVAFGISHKLHHQVPVVAVTSSDGFEKNYFLKEIKRILGNSAPVICVPVIDFPRNSMQKILRREMAEEYGRILGIGNPAINDRNNFSHARSVLMAGSFEITFSIPKGSFWEYFKSLATWLNLLDDDEKDQKLNSEPGAVHEGFAWLDVVLALSTSLLRSLLVPVFVAPAVRSCLQEAGEEQKWKAVCERPDPSLVPPEVFEGVLKAAFKLATWCATANSDSSVDRERFFNFIETDVRRPFMKMTSRGKSTIEVLRVAHWLNIPYSPLPGGTFQIGMGSAGCRIDRSTTDQDSALGTRWTMSKMLTAQLLRRGGLPAPRHVSVNSVEQAKKASEHIGFPLVVKPSDLERGEGVTVDVHADNLEAAFNEAVKRSPNKEALIEQQVAGVCHRLFVLDGKLLYAVRRLPIGVYADGQSSIKDLVNAECQAQNRMPPWKRSGIRPLDDLAIHMLRRQGWTDESIPATGRFVALRRIETTAWGGVDEDVTETIHPDNVKAAIETSKLFGLQVAGVDIISQDITQPWHGNGAVINEVNYAPLLGGGEISRSHIPTFLNTLIRDGGRIPIHVHVGGSEALDAAREEWKHMVNCGLGTALVSSQQTLLSDGLPKVMPLAGLYARCRSLILSPDLVCRVLVVQDDEFLNTGLPIDAVTVVRDTGGELVSHREKSPLPDEQANNLRLLLKSWGRGADDGAQEA